MALMQFANILNDIVNTQNKVEWNRVDKIGEIAKGFGESYLTKRIAEVKKAEEQKQKAIERADKATQGFKEEYRQLQAVKKRTVPGSSAELTETDYATRKVAGLPVEESSRPPTPGTYQETSFGPSGFTRTEKPQELLDMKKEAATLKKAQIKRASTDEEFKQKMGLYNGYVREADKMRSELITQGMTDDEISTNPQIQLLEGQANDAITSATTIHNEKFPSNPINQRELREYVVQEKSGLFGGTKEVKKQEVVAKGSKKNYVLNQIIDIPGKGKYKVTNISGKWSPENPFVEKVK